MTSCEKKTVDNLPVVYPRDDHCISRKNIDPDALKILYRLIRSGHKAYLVGGGVRDLLLNKAPKDFDIATDATPRQIRSLFRNSRIIGRRFKLVHIYFKDRKIIEVSTFRDSNVSEVEDEQTHMITQDNVYGSEATDAIRRDITINGLFYNLSNFSIIDYVNGIPDLRDRIIRVIGCPENRFIEDPIRMLRVVRHAVRSESSIETHTADAILKHHSLIEKCPYARVYAEISRDFLSAHFWPILHLLSQTALLEHFFPQLDKQKEVLFHTDNHLQQSLVRFDSFVQKGAGFSITTILSLITLFSEKVAPELDHLAEQIVKKDYINSRIKNAFSKVIIPRKEKEKISTLLLLWRRLVVSQGQGTSVESLAKRLCLDDLIAFFDCLPESDPEQKISKLLTKAKRYRAKLAREERNKTFQKRRKRTKD